MLTDPATLHALRRHHLFHKLPADIFQEVCSLAIHRRLENGETLFHQGEAADRFYLLIDGQMKLTRVLFEGQEKLVEVIQPGQSFAEALLFNGARHYPVTAGALKASTLASIELVSAVGRMPTPSDLHYLTDPQFVENSTSGGFAHPWLALIAVVGISVMLAVLVWWVWRKLSRGIRSLLRPAPAQRRPHPRPPL